MATTTTNYGWDIPQSTDLVKDGATAIATLGQDIDTAFVDLKGGTTGQVLSKTSNTDLDFTWVAQDDSNAIQNAIVDAKGDLIAATAADTPARLAVGTNNQVLMADSTAATGLKWATPSTGSMTLLSTTTMNSGTNTQTVSGISTSYTGLKIIVRNGYNTAGDFGYRMRINGDSGTNYSYGYAGQYWAGYDGTTNLSNLVILGNRNSNSTTWSKQGYGVFDISNYNAAGQILVKWSFINHDGGGGNTITFTEGICVYNAAAAMTSFSLLTDTSGFTGGTIQTYGVN
jgi:hypothetical protein